MYFRTPHRTIPLGQVHSQTKYGFPANHSAGGCLIPHNRRVPSTRANWKEGNRLAGAVIILTMAHLHFGLSFELKN